ncbi:Stk1 family PASTA domain-containing Ser/Thr kinase [Furfurilactobacillus rossiae]|uniref:non-specific serine/threonine protein kinase n=1 Tax=Furfurilactobacillus rossiae DSM 15814 TaxID=1114972 RepID=A0A0R1RTT5_9LACO|nr:Stk1 family PASTA domain-containing Ser/Thr kinase [Furfurilactobacillus rossiae]KRL57317.1 non-specific serine threonine protein kinase [Furfurilactobacillus rossiae DSM 15814]MCF6164938.1 Stk1 family PASTA domain-containing Ser/Thr kinase [Furfurilactobacillus rossiae]QFR65809.1 Stk1 family PASTA domain-containing Ser/Thr kinase [Furfurilactobacillus rossiae]QLE61213.1 Serine-threonine protein kinase PrkC regulator of stationary phase [Furfurilactobacillus rossiae]QLE63955.1 Serine-threon
MRPNYTLAGRYRIIRPLGEGGMADVYLAHDLILDRDVSVKLLRLDLRDDPSTERRFQREAMAASELVSPHIVSVYDVGEDNGMQYLVMEYVSGTDLKMYIRNHFPIPYPTVVNLMQQILDGVRIAHEHGIIHRDLKPQNVLVDQSGQLKISDFGIAVISSESSMTQTNTVLGSVHYLSPEQARGGMASKKSDIYSLGIILYEMLTGSVPFEGETAVSIALKHSQSNMPSVRDYDPRIPQPLENIILHATAKNPSDRYVSVQAMANDLATALSPERRDEKRFEPRIVDDGATKVIPVDQILAASNQQRADSQISRQEPTSAAAEVADTPSRKSPARARRLFGWLFGVAVVLVLGVLAWIWLIPGQVTVPNVAGMTPVKAAKVLKHNQLRLGKQTKATSERRAKGEIIKATPAIGSQAKQQARVNVVVSSGRPKISVDDYTGERYTTAVRQLKKLGLTATRVDEYTADAANGVIVDQDVVPGDTVYRHSTITFTVSSGSSHGSTVKHYKMPNFAGDKQTEVQQWAEDHSVTVTFSDETSTTVAQGKIIRQAPTSGSMISAGQTFAAVVSSGPALHNFHVNLTIPYKAPSNDPTGTNDIKIYIKDHDKKLTDVYQQLQISSDTDVSLPFTTTTNGEGEYVIKRDGHTIMADHSVTSGN